MRVSRAVLGVLALVLLTVPARAERHRYTDAQISKVFVPFVTSANLASNSELRHLEQPIVLDDSNGANYPSLAFDVTLATSSKGDSTRTLQFAFIGETRPFLDGYATLFLDDDAQLTLSGPAGRPANPRVSRSSADFNNGLLGLMTTPELVYEVLGFEIDCRQLATLATANKVKVMLVGSQRSIVAWMPKQALAAIRTMRIESNCPAGSSKN